MMESVLNIVCNMHIIKSALANIFCIAQRRKRIIIIKITKFIKKHDTESMLYFFYEVKFSSPACYLQEIRRDATLVF